MKHCGRVDLSRSLDSPLYTFIACIFCYLSPLPPIIQELSGTIVMANTKHLGPRVSPMAAP